MLGLEEARQASPGQASLRAPPWVKRPPNHQAPNGAGHECCAHCIPQLCYAPLGLYPFYISRPQGGARSSLATGWLVAGRWPEETMLAHEHPLPRLKIRCLASKRPDKPAQGKASLRATPRGQRPAKSSSPHGAGQKWSHALHPAKLFRPVGALPILSFPDPGRRSFLACPGLACRRPLALKLRKPSTRGSRRPTDAPPPPGGRVRNGFGRRGGLPQAVNIRALTLRTGETTRYSRVCSALRTQCPYCASKSTPRLLAAHPRVTVRPVQSRSSQS